MSREDNETVQSNSPVGYIARHWVKADFLYQFQQVGSTWETQPPHAVHFFSGFEKLAPKVENSEWKKTGNP